MGFKMMSGSLTVSFKFKLTYCAFEYVCLVVMMLQDGGCSKYAAAYWARKLMYVRLMRVASLLGIELLRAVRALNFDLVAFGVVPLAGLF
jgi:hypothetical protein